jgi:hypothetical protein
MPVSVGCLGAGAAIGKLADGQVVWSKKLKFLIGLLKLFRHS